MMASVSPVTAFAAEPPSANAAVSGGTAVNPGLVETMKPLWSVITDDDREQGTAWQHRTALYMDKGIVATITSGQLVALQVRSGKRLWKFGGNLVSYVYSDSYGFYVITKGGLLTAVSPTGKKRWSAAIGTFNSGDKIIYLGNFIGVVQGSTIRAFRISNGELKWTMKDAGSPLLDYQMINGELVGDQNGDGAFATTDVVAFDWVTGKFLWKTPGHELPEFIGNQPYLYSRKIDIPFNLDAEERTVTLDGIGSTGKIEDTRIFKHQVAEPGTQAGNFYPRVVWHDNWLYIFWGDVIEGYDLLSGGWDSPVKRFPQPADTEPTGIVAYDGFQMRNIENGELSIVRMNSGQHVTWPSSGKTFLEAESLGRGLYERYVGGLLRAVDQRNGKVIFQANTGTQPFAGPVLRVGSYIVVQKEGTLQSYLLPEQLQ